MVETRKPGLIRRLYGISRLRRELENLEIARCMYLGDELTVPLPVAVIAHGGAVWTESVQNDFVYTNNAVSDCNYVWTRSRAPGGGPAC